MVVVEVGPGYFPGARRQIGKAEAEGVLDSGSSGILKVLEPSLGLAVAAIEHGRGLAMSPVGGSFINPAPPNLGHVVLEIALVNVLLLAFLGDLGLADGVVVFHRRAL